MTASTLPQFARVVAFDLDDTLAPSKSPIEKSVSDELQRLLERVAVCVISGGNFTQFEQQLLANLVLDADEKANLHLMPTCGTRYYKWQDSAWTSVYAEDLTEAEKASIIAVLEEGIDTLGLRESTTWGPTIEDRGSQITFSALGQKAPHSEKVKWDPDGAKRQKLRQFAAERLPDLEVRGGGSTSIDVTRKGIDKAYGMTKLMSYLNVTPADILFVGDRLDVDGNDYPVYKLGVPSVRVANWQETATLIPAIIKWLDGDDAGDRPFTVMS